MPKKQNDMGELEANPPVFSAEDIKELQVTLDAFLLEVSEEALEGEIDEDLEYLKELITSVKTKSANYNDLSLEEKNKFLMELTVLLAMMSEISGEDEDDFEDDEFSDLFDEDDFDDLDEDDLEEIDDEDFDDEETEEGEVILPGKKRK